MIFPLYTLKNGFYKGRLCPSKGVTVVELVLVIFLMTLILTVTVALMRPWEQNARARDNKRLSDLSVLERVINEYFLDNGEYPDSSGETRVSTTLPSSNIGPLQSATSGWLVGDFSKYNSYLPTDPVNDATYRYSYHHNATGYELNVVLEYDLAKSADDGGNNNSIFELGNNLTLL